MGETLTADPYAGFEDDDPYAGFDADAPAPPPAPTRSEAEAEFPMPQRFQRRPVETLGPALLKPKVQGLPPEEGTLQPDPYDQRTTMQNLGGAVRRGFEGQVVQPSAARSMDALDRQTRAMDAIDAGQIVPPGDDPMGYGTSDAQTRAMIRESVRQQAGATMGAFQASRKAAQAIPPNPRLGAMAGQIDAGEYGAAARTFASDPFGITGQVMAESAPSILPQLVLGPTSAALGAGRGARMLWNGIGAYLGDQPARGIEILDDVMQKAGVNPDDPAAMQRFIQENPGVIGNAFRRAGMGSAGLALVSGLTAGLSRPLAPAGGLRGNVAPIGVNLGASLVGEPSGEAVAQGITYGEIKSPSDVALEAIGGVPMAGVQTAQETIAAARQPGISPGSSPDRPLDLLPPSAPAGLPPAAVAEAPPSPAAPSQAAAEAGVAPPPAIPPSSPAGPPPIPLPPMPPVPQTLAQIQTEQGVSSTDAARIRLEQEGAFIDWHDQNMPGADVVMPPPGDPLRDAAVKRAELEAALAEPAVASPPRETNPVVSQEPPVGDTQAALPTPQAFPTSGPAPITAEAPEAAPAPPPPPVAGTRRRTVRVQTPEDMAKAAAVVAQPKSAEQAAAGTYQHGHVVIGAVNGRGGIPIAIETPAGATRSGTAPDGTPWTSTMGADYGRIKRTTGADGDQVDVFLGPQAHEATKHPVWVIDQLTTGDTVKFDEHKAMVGFPTKEAAEFAYLASFSDAAGTDRIGAVTQMPWSQFKRWAKSGDTKKPLKYAPPKIKAKAKPRVQKGPLSLLQFLAGKGGLAPHGDLKAMGAHTRSVFGVGGPKRLVRGKGMDLDMAREAAEEAGYIRSADGSGTTTTDLLNAIDEEMRGRKVFSSHEAGEAYLTEMERRTAAEDDRRDTTLAEVDAWAQERGVNLSPDEREAIAQAVLQGALLEDAFDAVLERSAIQVEDALIERAPQDGDWDIPFDEGGPTYAEGEEPDGFGQEPDLQGEEPAGPDATPEGRGDEGGAERDGGGQDAGRPAADDASGGVADAEGEAAGGVDAYKREVFAAVTARLDANRPVQFSTYARTTRIEPKHREAIRFHNGDIQVRRGKHWDTLIGQALDTLAKNVGVKTPFERASEPQTETVDTLDGDREQGLLAGVAPITEEDRKAAAKPEATPAPPKMTIGMFGPVGQTDLVAATNASYGNIAAPNEAALTEAFRKRIADKGDFPSVQQAMAYAGKLLGASVLPGSRAAGVVESALEAAKPQSAQAPTPAPTTVPEWVQDHADDAKGDVVFWNGTVGLVRGYSVLNGKAVYVGIAPNQTRTRVDIDGFTNSRGMFTDEQLATLKAAKAEDVRVEAEAEAQFPDGPFTGGGRIVGSDSVPPQLIEMARDLLKLVGIDKRVFIVDPKDMRGDAVGKYHLRGRWLQVRAGALQDTGGSVRRLSNGDFTITLAPKRSNRQSYSIEMLAHEVGHIVESEVYANADPQEKRAIEAAFRAWLADNKPKQAADYVAAMRAHTTGKLTNSSPGVLAADLTPYWHSFSEWFADQVARWTVSESKPASIVDRLFARIGAAYRRLMQAAGDRYRAAPAMREWLNKRVDFVTGEARTAASAEQAARSDEASFSLAPNRVSPQAASLAAGARNQERRGDVRRGAGAILDRLRMQENLDRAAARRQEREGGRQRSITDADAIREVDGFIQWLGEHMVSDVGLRMSQQDAGAYGQFEVSRRIVTIFRRAIDTGNLDRVMVHELWHAMEAALPPADRAAVTQEYLRARDAWLGKNEWARTFLSGDQILDQISGDEAQAWLDANPDRSGLPVVVDTQNGRPRVRVAWNGDTYRFRDRHEYFAETMADRYFNSRDIQDAKARSVFAHVRDAFRRMVAALKRLFGRDATGRIFDGFDRREYPTPAQRMVADEIRLAGLDGIRAVRPDAMLSEIRFARAPTAQTAMPMAPTATFASPPESRLDSFIYEIQNKQVDLKRVQEAITRAGRAIGVDEDAYLAEELYHGRTAKRTADFINEELRPLVEDMVGRGVTMAELQKFLHARHAEEYNNHVASRDPNRPDGGSGMMTADARAILAGYPPAQMANFTALARQVDAITRRTRNTLVQYGMEPQERMDAWENLFPFYVPMNREDMDTIGGGGSGSGQGYSVRGEFSRPALGSDRDVANIIASIALQRERAIVRGEKNIVANALIELARRNPNPDFWTVNQPARIRTLDANGQVISIVDPNYKGRDNVIVARSLATRGPGAGRTIIEQTLMLNQENDRAVRMAKALKNLDLDDLGHLLGPVSVATRTIAALNTQYNPVFGITNLVRDVQEAAVNLTSTPLAGKQREVAALVPQALRGIYTDLRAARRGASATNQWGRLWEDFQRLGGQTGFRDLWATNADRAKAIESEIKRVTEGKAKQFGRAVFGWLSDYNEAMENSVRLAVFKVALDQGIAPERAASIAKNITVNFNRKGAMTTQVAALYAFFNAAAQGTTRALKTLAGPAGRKIIAGGVLIGSMQALMLAGAGFSDEDIPDFVREKNLIIPIGGKRYITIPMPLGFSVFPNIGRMATEMALDGGKDAGKKAVKMLGVVANSFNPLGGSGSVSQMLSPTVSDPIFAVDANKDWTGRPIARPNISSLDERPGHERKKDVASIWSEYVSRALNSITGGTEFKPGLLSPSPDHIDYLVGQYTGGFVREVNKAGTAAVAAYRGDDVPSSKIPLVGRFYGNAEGTNAVRTAYFENLKWINQERAELKGRSKAQQPTDGYVAENPGSTLFQSTAKSIDEIRRQQQHIRGMRARNAPAADIRKQEAEVRDKMIAFNKRVDAARNPTK